MKKKSILMLSLILSVFVMTANSAITVRMKNTAQWSPVGLYAWEGGDALPSELNSWPGIELTADADGLYSYTFPEGVTSVNIIFNNMQNKDNANTDKFQTNDIKGVTESTCYEVLGNKNHKVIDCAEAVLDESTLYEFKKVTSTADITAGDYLIVYEDETRPLIFNGSLANSTSDSVGIGGKYNNYAVTITDGVIACSADVLNKVFTIAAIENSTALSIKSASGIAIGRDGTSNGLDKSTSKVYENTLTYNTTDNVADIVSKAGLYMRFNKSSSEQRFRYFKADTYTAQEPVQLYKKVAKGSVTPTHVYSLVGDLFTWSWTPADAEEMTAVNDSVYTYVIDSMVVEAKKYEYKLTADHQWGVYELPASGNAEYTFTESGDYKLEFTANIASHTLGLEATKLAQDPTPVVDDVYTVVGSAVNGDNWVVDNTANDMTLVEGVYTLVVKEKTLEKGTREYKIVKNHSWAKENEVYPLKEDNSNATFDVAETAIYTITYTYNPATGAVNVNLEKTGEAAPITHVYSLVGTHFSWGWEPANAPEMNKVNDSIYTYQIDTFAITAAPDTLYYKLTADHQWGVYELPSSGNNDYIFNEVGKYHLVFTANIASHTLGLEATKFADDTTVVTTKYYIAGTMNGWTVNGTEIINGTVTLKDLAAGKHEFKVTDGEWGSGHEFTTLDTECTSEGVTGGNGQNIVFTTSTVQDVTITFDGTLICVKVVTGEAPKTYYVAGTEALTGKNWWVDYAEAALVNGTITFKDVAAGTHEFKITDGQWGSGHEFTALDTECSSEGVTGGNGSNIKFDTYKVQDITIAMDLVTFAICVTADTEKPAGVEDTYVIAGDSELLGVGWSGTEEQNKMTLTDSVATLVIDSIQLSAKTYEFKVVRNGSSWIPDGTGNNSQLLIAEAGLYKVTFTYVVGSEAATAEATLLSVPVVTPSDYYIKHPWAGGEWTWKKMNKEATADLYTIDGIWGGYGANINTSESDTGASWFETANINGAATAAVGDTVIFTFNSADITLAVTITGKAPATPDVYTVVGTAVNGDNWVVDNTDNDMTLVEGVYTLVVKEKTLEKGTREYKIVKNHSWANENEVYPLKEDNSNATFDVPETAIYTITYTYDPQTGAVNVNLEKTGEAAPITHVYSLVGTHFSWGWEPANAPEMNKVNDSIYTYQIDTFAITAAPDTLYYKLTADHQWGVYELPSSGNNDYIFNEVGKYHLVFTANIASHTLDLEATKFADDTTVVTTKYYIAGTMNGWTVNGTEIVDGTVTFKDLPAGKHEFKVTDGQWGDGHEFTTLDTECTSQGVTGGNGQNIVFTTSTVQDVTITFDGSLICVKVVTGEAPKVYYLAGDEGLMGTGHGWWKDYADRALDANGSITIKDVPAGAHAFKITDGNWNSDTEKDHEFTTLDTECTSNGVTGGNGSNIEFTTYKVQDVTISMDLTTFLVCVKADCDKPAEFEDTYIIAGDEKLLGVSWSGTAEANKMTIADGTATLVLDSVHLSAGNYEFKVVKNGGQWIPDGTGNNSVLSINEEADYKVTFTYVIGEQAASAVAEKLGEPVVVDVDYYLFGYINGANYGCEDDYLNMGEYKFVDGKLTATFTEKSYVAVKTTGNAAWFMTNGYPGDDATSAVLYNTQNLGETADKLPVPASVEVNFTLVVNDDGTLTLSYVAGTGSGIDNIESVLDTAAPMYNVLGQKVNAQYKGIIIQNGKKYLVR